MQLIREISDFDCPKETVVTIGNFDGVHLGHQRLLKATQQVASQSSLSSIMLTFEPNPKEFFTPSTPASRLMRWYEKWQYVTQYEIDYFCCLRFNADLAALSPEEFVKSVLVDALKVKAVIVGDDFHFGAKRAGDARTLAALGEKHGFSVEALTQSIYQGERISSSRVRNTLQNADFKTIALMTGRPYSLSGRVAYGQQMGRKLGYPTANIHLHRKQVPLMGIYIVQVRGLSEKPLPAVASIGYRPTFGGKQIILEVHLFNFDQMIYGRRLTVEFLHKIREEIKFDSVEALIKKMDNDAAIARAYFGI